MNIQFLMMGLNRALAETFAPCFTDGKPVEQACREWLDLPQNASMPANVASVDIERALTRVNAALGMLNDLGADKMEDLFTVSILLGVVNNVTFEEIQNADVEEEVKEEDVVEEPTSEAPPELVELMQQLEMMLSPKH